jgi:hypothetical protein
LKTMQSERTGHPAPTNSWSEKAAPGSPCAVNNPVTLWTNWCGPRGSVPDPQGQKVVHRVMQTRARTLFGHASLRNSVSRRGCRAGRETEFRKRGFPNGSLGTRKAVVKPEPGQVEEEAAAVAEAWAGAVPRGSAR